MAVIKGRSAEVNERLGISSEAIRRQKDDALSEIAIKLEKIRELRPSKFQESLMFAETWTKRLEPSIPSQPAPAYSPPISAAYPATPARSPITPVYRPPAVTTPTAVELDTTPRSSVSAALTSFAELDISGQLVAGRFLQPESEPRYY